MIVIQFECSHECRTIYRTVHYYFKTMSNKNGRKIIVQYDANNRLIIDYNNDMSFYLTYIQPLLVQVFTKYIMSVYEKRYLFQLLKENYYFKDEEEIKEITSIAKAVMDGEKQDVSKTKNLLNRRELLEEAITNFLVQPLSFCFNSFVKFRLKHYRELLNSYIELAIDEYKLEHDYQDFIQSLRCFLKHRTPLVETVHLMYEHQPVFYNEALEEINADLLQSIVNQTKIECSFTELDTVLIRPLLVIAPKHVYFYTAHEELSIVYTLQNIFQERIQLSSPFDFYKKRFYKPSSLLD